MSDIAVLEGAEAFEVGEGSVGALLVHGFTGSPQGMRALGDHLAANGMAATGVRLPGHGTTWQDLNTRTHEEWTGAVEEGYEKLATRCDKIFVVGLSFGSALAVDFTARNPEKVSGVVLLASYIMTKDPRRFLAPAIRLVVQSLPGVGNDIADPDMREIVYNRVPTKAAYSMLQFIRGARAKLPRVTRPTLIMHAKKDHTAHPDNAQLIFDAIKSTDKELVWLDRSYHVITVDYERQQVYDKTLSFMKEHAKSGV